MKVPKSRADKSQRNRALGILNFDGAIRTVFEIQKHKADRGNVQANFFFFSLCKWLRRQHDSNLWRRRFFGTLTHQTLKRKMVVFQNDLELLLITWRAIYDAEAETLGCSRFMSTDRSTTHWVQQSDNLGPTSIKTGWLKSHNPATCHRWSPRKELPRYHHSQTPAKKKARQERDEGAL